MILSFGLTKIIETQTPTMERWLAVEYPALTDFEQTLFDLTFNKGRKKMQTWSEENLKMQFISPILQLG